MDVTVNHLDFTSVQPGTDLQIQIFHDISDCTSTFDCPCRSVEPRQHTVASELHDVAPPGSHVSLDDPVMRGKNTRPSRVT